MGLKRRATVAVCRLGTAPGHRSQASRSPVAWALFGRALVVGVFGAARPKGAPRVAPPPSEFPTLPSAASLRR